MRELLTGVRVRVPERLLVGALGVFVVAAYLRRHPLGPISLRLDLVGLPHPGKILSLLGLLALLFAINLCAWSLGDLLLRRLRDDVLPPRERALWKLALGLLALPYLVLLLAALHLLVVPAFAALLIVPVLARALLRRPGNSAAGSAAQARALGFLVLAALLLGNAFLGLFGPWPGWDALTYHLALPERYLFANGIVVTPFVWASTFPLNAEMLYVLALGIGNDVLARMLHFEFGALTLWALFLLGGRVSPRAALLAPLFMAANPLFLRELTWAYSDLVGALYMALAATALADYRSEPRRSHLVLCGLAAGACVGARYLGGAVAISLCAALWGRPREWRANLRACAWIGGLALLALAPWLIRNVAFTGNPLAPLLQWLFHEPGSEYFDPITIAQNLRFTGEIGLGRSLGALLAAPWNVIMETDPRSYRESFGHPIGALPLVGAAAALLVGEVRRQARARLFLQVGLVFFLVWFFTFQEVRYLFPLFALTSALGAWAFDALLPRPLLGGRPRAAAALLAIPLVAAGAAQLRLLDRFGERWALALGPLSAPLELQGDGSTRAAAFLRRELAPGERVLLFYESRGYLFRGLDYIPFFTAEASTLLQLVHRAEDAADLRCRLQALGVSHVLVNHEMLRRAGKFFVEGYASEDFAADLARLRALLRDGATPLWSEAEVSVSRLNPAACG